MFSCVEKKQRMSIFFAAVVGLLTLGSGCAGQLKGAMVEHARSTRSVADTIKKAMESVKCDAQAAACPTALMVIEDQVKALQSGATKLESSGQ